MTTTLLRRGDVVPEGWLFTACDLTTVAYGCDTHGQVFPHRSDTARRADASLTRRS